MTSARPLFRKIRYVVGEQKLFKVNEGPPTPISLQATESMVALLEDELQRHDALVATDFGYGLFGSRLTEAVSEMSRAQSRLLRLRPCRRTLSRNR